MQSIGEMAYERYNKMMNGRGAGGKKLKPWKELSDDIQEEWTAAALNLGMAKTAVESQRERPSGGKRV